MQNDIFFKEDTKISSDIEFTTIDQKKKEIIKESLDTIKLPIGYIPIEIESTKGKLQAPKVLHFRNFTLEEIAGLVIHRDSIKFYKTLIGILTDMNFEKFDCGKLHIEELKEILIKIFVNFISPILRNQRYYYDQNLNDNIIDREDNIGTIDIDLTKLNSIRTLPPEFCEPIKIPIKTGYVKMVLPKVEQLVVASEYADKIMESFVERYDKINSLIEQRDKLEQDIEDYSKNIEDISAGIEDLMKQMNNGEEAIEENAESNQDVIDALNMQKNQINSELEYKRSLLNNIVISKDDLEYCETFKKNKYIKFLNIYQNLCVISINDIELSKEDCASAKIDFMAMAKFDSIIHNLDFGIDGDYTFYCEKYNKQITRRFRFRLFSLFHSLQLQNFTKDDF